MQGLPTDSLSTDNGILVTMGRYVITCVDLGLTNLTTRTNLTNLTNLTIPTNLTNLTFLTGHHMQPLATDD